MAARPQLQDAIFYAILDTAYVPRERWKATCAALIDGGAGLVQLRAKRETADERARLLDEILPLFARGVAGGFEPSLIVNDDIGLCLRNPGTGLHIGQDDTPAAEARARLGPGRLLGLSTHSPQQAAAALALADGVLDYFAVGPVFATRTKPDYPPVGLELVRHVAGLRPRLPWYCIGGITRANVDGVIAAGAARVVSVSDVLLDDDPAGAVRALAGRLSGT